MSKVTPLISKAVGWECKLVNEPNMFEVEAAIEREDIRQLLTWNRFLPLSTNTEVTKRIHDYLLSD